MLYIMVDDAEVMACELTNNYQSFTFGCNTLTSGSVYQIYTGGTYSGGSNCGCYHYGGTYSGGTLKKSGTVSQQQTTVSF